MGESPEHRTGMSAGHWLGLGCGVALAVLAMAVIGLVNARRPRENTPVAVTLAPPVAGDELTAVEAQPGRDPFARDGGAPADQPSADDEPAADDAEPGGESTPPQQVTPMPGPMTDEEPVDEPPADLPEPSVGRGRRGGGGGDDGNGGDEGGDEGAAAPAAKPKPRMPTVAELKPHDPKEPPAWAAPPQAAEGGLDLVAVIAGRQPMAIFRKEGVYRRMRLGDEIEGLKIERIDTTGVYLKDGDHRFLIRMPATIRPGGQRGGTASAPRTPAATPEPETPPAETPVTTPRPTPELAPLPAPTGPSMGRGGTAGDRPSGGQRPGGWQRPGGQGGGQGGGPGGGPGGGGFGGGGGRRRPPADEGDGEQ